MRTVKVGLEADVAAYVGSVLEADKATEKLDHSVEGLDKDIDKLKRDSIGAGLGVDTLGESAKKTSEDVDKLGNKSDTTGDKTDKLGRKSRDVAAALKLVGIEAQDAGDKLAGVDKKNSLTLIDDKIKSIRAELKDLATEFNKTGNVSILDKIGSGKKDLDALGKLKGLVSGALKAGAEEESIFSSLKTNLTSAFEGGFSSPASIAIIAQAIGVALAAAGGLAAGLAGTLFAGAGVGGAILGHPQQFHDAWVPVIRSVKKEFEDASNPFTGPALTALKSVGPTVASWHLGDALAPAVKYVPELTAGIERFATGVVHGLAELTAKGGPAVAVLADGIGKLGDAIDSAFTSIAGGADGGAQALHDVLEVVDLTIVAFGKLVEGAEKVYGVINDHPIELAIATGGLSAAASLWTNALGNASAEHGRFTLTAKGAAEAARDAGHAFSEEGTDLTALQNQLNAANVTFDKLAGGKITELLNQMLGLDHATLSFDESLTGLSETLKQNKNALDIHSKAGQADREAVLAVVAANVQQYQTMIQAGATLPEASQAYDDNTAALERNLKKAGLNKQAIEDLIGKYREIPKKTEADIAINGLTDAINNLADLIRQIYKINGKNFGSTFTVTYKTVGHPLVGEQGTIPLHPGSAQRFGGVRRAADGLVVPPSDPGTVLFGEPQTGGEVFLPLRGIGKDRAMSLAQVAGDAYGFGVAPRNGMASGGQWRTPSASAVRVSVEVGAGANLTPLGSLFNQMLNDGLFVVKASQVRPNV